MQRRQKKYPVENSPLFGLKNKRRLSTLLKLTSVKEINRLLDDEANYRIYPIIKGGKKRQIENPNEKLKAAQRNLSKLISRIQHPDWLMSGVKGKSYVDNAREHIHNLYLSKMDISGFYQSCRRQYAFKFFHRHLNMSEDVSWVLTDLVFFNDYLPTGSPASQIIAFWSYYPCFQKIVDLAKSKNILITLYVDDFTLSSNKQIPGSLLYAICGELKKVGLKVKRKKTRHYSSKEHKKVTGVIITTDNNLRIPNKLRVDIIRLAEELEKRMNEKKYNSLLGKLRAARCIEPHAFDNLYNRLKKTKI